MLQLLAYSKKDCTVYFLENGIYTMSKPPYRVLEKVKFSDIRNAVETLGYTARKEVFIGMKDLVEFLADEYRAANPDENPFDSEFGKAAVQFLSLKEVGETIAEIGEIEVLTGEERLRLKLVLLGFSAELKRRAEALSPSTPTDN